MDNQSEKLKENPNDNFGFENIFPTTFEAVLYIFRKDFPDNGIFFNSDNIKELRKKEAKCNSREPINIEELTTVDVWFMEDEIKPRDNVEAFQKSMKGMDFSEYFFENFGGFRSQKSFVALPLSKDSKNWFKNVK